MFHKERVSDSTDTPDLSSMLTASNYQAAGNWDLSNLGMLGCIDWSGKLCKIGEKRDDLVSDWRARDSCEDVPAYSVCPLHWSSFSITVFLKTL